MPVTELERGHSFQGYFYALPRTVLVVDVEIKKLTQVPGPFAEYAGKYLSIDNVISSQSTSYALGEIKVSSYAEPDPLGFYFIEYDPEANKGNQFAIQLTEEGIIASVNSPTTDPGVIKANIENRTQTSFGSRSTFNHFIETGLQEKIDTIVERVRMDTITVERQTLRRRWVEKTSEVRAKEVAEYILKLRNKRFDIVSGFAEITYSKDAIEYMNLELQKMEDDYLELFTGITTESEMKFRFYFLPDASPDIQTDTLFYFDERYGIVKNPGMNTEPVKLTLNPDRATVQMSMFTPVPDEKSPHLKGIHYRFPQHAYISIDRNDLIIADARLIVSQLGELTYLPTDDLVIEFYPDTGAIKSVNKIERD